MLRLLGPTRVSGTAGQRLPQAAFLAVAMLDLAPGRTLTREALASRLWEGAPAGKANGSLRTLIKRIRDWEQANGASVLEATPTHVVRDHTSLPSDLSRFMASESLQSAVELRLFSELYGGDFLTGVEDSSDNTGVWIKGTRAWLRERFIKIALAGAQQVGGPVADEVLRRLAEEEPYDDAIARAAMIAARHDPARVRSIYETFARRVLADLSHEPEAATTELLRELTQGTLLPAAPRTPASHAHVVASLDGVPRVLILPPIEGGLVIEDRQLGDALVDEVTHTLGRLRTFAVFAPYTARQVITSPFPSGNPYGADYVVSTRFAPGPGVNRLRVSLTRFETHELLLTEELPFARGDLAAHHYHLAAALGTRLAEGIERTERHMYLNAASPSAYVHYLEGCEALRGIDLQSVRRARNHLRDALKLSHDFVAARALLARTHNLEWFLLNRNEREPIQKAIELAREAAALDPTDPNAHREIGHALIYLGAVDEAVESLRIATRLGPHNADVLFHYGDGLLHQGEIVEARRVLDRALSLNPLAPDVYYWVTATVDYSLGHYAAASEMVSRMKNSEPAARFIAAVEAMNGNPEEAARHRDIFLSAHPDFRLADYLFPLKPEVRERYFEGLRRAGFD
jgi:DNA-binding SARP family transcriptional activator/tetratricopeptide (TPR) repeat protein